MSELLIGCGHSREKRIHAIWDAEKRALVQSTEWTGLTTLDSNKDCNPDVLYDLNQVHLPFADNDFDQIHAYEVLEHLGKQGDAKFFFDQFTEFWRILKPDGLFCATVPRWDSLWAWGDPSHTRVINEGTITFLSQAEYVKQLGKTAMSDFRSTYKADFEIIHGEKAGEQFVFILRAIKAEGLK